MCIKCKINWRLPSKLLLGIIAVLVFSLLLLWVHLHQREKKLMEQHIRVLYDTTELRSGDLMFRNGLSAESLVVTQASNSDYSHVGIAYHMPSGWHVIHAVPGEAPQGEPEYLKCEPIADFYDPSRAMAGASASIRCDNASALRAAREAFSKVEQKVLFDNDYDLNDTTELYCSELVWRAYLEEGINLVNDGNSYSTIYPELLWTSPQIAKRKVFRTTIEK